METCFTGNSHFSPSKSFFIQSARSLDSSSSIMSCSLRPLNPTRDLDNQHQHVQELKESVLRNKKLGSLLRYIKYDISTI